MECNEKATKMGRIGGTQWKNGLWVLRFLFFVFEFFCFLFLFFVFGCECDKHDLNGAYDKLKMFG